MTMLPQLANGREILPAQPATSAAAAFSLKDIEVMARQAAASRLVGMDAAQAFTLMMVAQSEGLHPMRALQMYHVIDGRPSMRADAMQAEFQRRGGRLIWRQTTRDRCVLEAWHPSLHPDHLTFELTLRELFDARVAARWDDKKREWSLKRAYQQFPRQMLRARAISEAVRAIDPGTVVGRYTPEEVLDMAAETTTPAPAPAPARRPRPAGRSMPQGFPEPEDDFPSPRVPRPWSTPGTAPGPAPGPTIPPPGPDPEPEPYPDPEPEPDPDPEPDDVASATATAPPEAISELRRFIRREIARANANLGNFLIGAGVTPTDRVDVANEHQVVNGVVSRWIADGLMHEAELAGRTGRRDRDRVGAAITAAYADDPEAVRADVHDYLAGKVEEAFAAHGPARPGDRDEAQAAGDGDGSSDQHSVISGQ